MKNAFENAGSLPAAAMFEFISVNGRGVPVTYMGERFHVYRRVEYGEALYRGWMQQYAQRRSELV